MIPVIVTPEEHQSFERGTWELPTFTHNDYPHVPGYLYGCLLCETECFCDADVEAGRAMPCIFCEDLNSE